MAGRRWARDQIALLDVERDHERIVHLSTEVRYGDPALTAALYTVAFLRQMAVPSIAAVLHRDGRGPIVRHTRRRNDETMVFFGEFMSRGHSSVEGRESIGRLNAIHAGFPITNEQSLYTLASLVFEAERIPRLLGLDPLSAKEKQASYLFWRGVGEQMRLHDIPASYDAFWAWTQEYEAREWGFSEGGEVVAGRMIDDYLARWLPVRLRGPARPLFLALCDDQLLEVLRLPRPSRLHRRAVALAVRSYFAGRRVLPDHQDRSWTEAFARPR